MSATFMDPARRRRRRLLALLAGAVLLSGATALVLTALRESIVFFFGPGELVARGAIAERIRLGGLVEEGSVREAEGGVFAFRVTDLETAVPVVYQGVLPDLFREGQGVVAEGLYRDGQLAADRILAKHDETYMPREVADALKAAGTWRHAEP